MDFLEELKWRGMLNDLTPGVEEALKNGKCVGYIGFDPTAPSLTIGNYVQIMLLSLFQRSGHQPIVLMGGATGRIGDPSGKDAERQLKSYEELDSNLAYQVELMKNFLDFENSDNKAILANNHDFYKDMNALDFLRDVGKTITVGYMMAKESVKRRIEKGLSFTEFSYQLIQGYDFQCLFQKYNCTIQMGGSDQWGNITTGTEFVRRNLQEKAYAITTPLLTKADGSKFGKSEKGNLWVDRKFTSPYEFYQFWLRCDDRDLPKFMRYFTFRSKEEVETLEVEYLESNPNHLKKLLSEELTARIYSQEELEAAKNVSELLFNKKASKEQLLSLNADSLGMITKEISRRSISKDVLDNNVNIMDFLHEHTSITSSKSDARRAIKNNAIAINKEKVVKDNFVMTTDLLLHDKYIMVENGRKNKFMIVVE